MLCTQVLQNHGVYCEIVLHLYLLIIPFFNLPHNILCTFSCRQINTTLSECEVPASAVTLCKLASDSHFHLVYLFVPTLFAKLFTIRAACTWNYHR